jgi:hypothetical protein
MERHLERKHGKPHPGAAPGKGKERVPARGTLARRLGNIRLVILALIVITGGFIAYMYLAPKEYGPHGKVTEECVAGHDAASYHIHVSLRIFVDGSAVGIPAGIGTSPCMRPLHTHDASGKVHVEYRHPSHFVLGEFFLVWGQPFDQNQVLHHQVGQGKSLSMKVDGSPGHGFEKTVLEDHQTIDIVYG